MAVTITMAADVTMDVITAGDFPAEIMAGDATMDVVTETAAGSLSYCFCCVAMDVAAAADNHYLPAEGNFPLPFSSVLESTSLLVESIFKLQLFLSRSVFYI